MATAQDNLARKQIYIPALQSEAVVLRVTADAIQIEPVVVAPFVAVPILLLLLIILILPKPKKKRKPQL